MKLNNELDLFYRQQTGFKNFLHKGLKKVKSVGKSALYSLGIATTSLIALTALPTDNVKTADDINHAINLLGAEDPYGSLINSNIFNKTGINIDKQIYIAPTVPSYKDTVNVVYSQDLSAPVMDALTDSLEEYNNVLKDTGKNYSLNLKRGSVGDIFDISLNTNFIPISQESGTFYSGYLAKGQRISPTICLSKDTINSNSYNMVRSLFTHELMHYFGIGDYYVYNQNSIDTIMDSNSARTNYLYKNDLSLLYATLSDIKTPQDAEFANQKIESHLNKFNVSNYSYNKLINKYGNNLSKQIKDKTGKDVNLSALNINNNYNLLNKQYKNNPLPLYFNNVNYQGLSYIASTKYISSVTNKGQKLMPIGEFFYNNVVVDCNGFFANFDKTGNLVDVYKDVSAKYFSNYETDAIKISKIKQQESDNKEEADNNLAKLISDYYLKEISSYSAEPIKAEQDSLKALGYTVSEYSAISADKNFMIVKTKKGYAKYDLHKLANKDDDSNDFSDYFEHITLQDEIINSRN